MGALPEEKGRRRPTEVVSDPYDVASRMNRMGIPLGIARIVMEEALAGHGRVTSNCPAGHDNYDMVGFAVGALRDELIPEKWEKSDKGHAKIFSPDRSMCVIVETGNEHTGDPDPSRRPMTKNLKGLGMKELVDSNANQLDCLRPLSEQTKKPPFPEDDSWFTVWILLLYVHIPSAGDQSPGVELRAELSQPRRTNAWNQPCDWETRLILPSVDGDGPASGQRPVNVPTPDVDIDVARRVS